MKIRSNRAELAEALTWVASAISKRPVSPALAGVRLTASDDRLTLAATNYDLSHSATLDVEVQDEGECLVAGQFLREIVSALKGPEVELVLDGERLSVTAGRSSYRLSVLRLDEYPHLPAFPAAVGELPADDLARMVAAVERSASRDETQGALTGVLVTGTSVALSMSTTDRYRIARAEAAWTSAVDAFAALPVMGPVASALKGMSGTIRLGAGGGLFGLADDRRTVTMRCLEVADYPKVDRALAREVVESVEISASELGEAVKRAALAADDFGDLRFGFHDGEVEITAATDTSDGAEYVECHGSVARDLRLTARYVTDALAAAGSARVRLGFTGRPDQVMPVFIRPPDSERVDILVMPRRQQ